MSSKPIPESIDYTRQIHYATETFRDTYSGEDYYIVYEIEPNAEQHRKWLINNILNSYNINAEDLVRIKKTTKKYHGTFGDKQMDVTFIG